MTGALAASLFRLGEDLAKVRVPWALVGGFAVSARAEPRFTRDVDVCVVADSDKEAERIVLTLTGMGYSIAALVEHEYGGRLATIRLNSPVVGGVIVDLLVASSGVEAEIVDSAEHLEILAGLTVPVARAGHLVVLKLLSRDATRPQDDMDLQSLRPVLTTDDESAATQLALLVTARGFGRGRDLPALLATYLAV